MEKLKKYDEFLNEETLSELIGFVLGMLTFFGIMLLARHIPGKITDLQRYINKLKTNKFYKKELFEILSDLTNEQKKQLKKYVKNSVFVEWTHFDTDITEEFIRDEKVDKEKEELLNIFDPEQRKKLELLLNRMEESIKDEVMKDGSEWGALSPNHMYDYKPLSIKSVRDKSFSEEQAERWKSNIDDDPFMEEKW